MSNASFSFAQLPPAEEGSVRITVLTELQSQGGITLTYVDPLGGQAPIVVDGGEFSILNRDM